MLPILVAVGCGFAPSAPPLSEATAQRAAGTWSGLLDPDGTARMVTVDLERADAGFSGTLGSPGPTDLDAVSVSDEGVTFSAATARFEGTWTDGKLDGIWTQDDSSLPLVLQKGSPARLARPQLPETPLPYVTEDVTVDGPAGVRLAGTLTLPAGSGPHPLVVLISGSGPHDRDASILGHRPFLVLADALTRAGVATFRYDDRGIGRSSGDFAKATTEDFAVDAGAVVLKLAGRTDIRRGQIGLLGQSEGALVAAIAAGRVPVRFVVMLAGAAVPGRDLVAGQVEALALAAGEGPEAAKAAREEQAALLGAVTAGATAGDLAERLRESGLSAPMAEGQARGLTTPWFRAYLELDPKPALAALQVPVLVLYGDLDRQVPPAENAPAMREALAGNAEATVEVLPGLNHLLQPAETGLPDEYGKIRTTLDQAAIDRVVGFVRSHVTQ